MDEWSDDGLDQPQLASVDTNIICAQKPVKRTGDIVFDLYMESTKLQDIKEGRKWATKHVEQGGIINHNLWLREYALELQRAEKRVFTSFKDLVLANLINKYY